MKIDIDYRLEGVAIDAFFVNSNNIPSKLPKNFIFNYNMTFEESVTANSEKIKIVFVVNIFLDQELKNHIGAIQTTTTYKILNFSELAQIGEVPKSFTIQLLGIAISTTRGILLVKGAGTALEHFILPIINPSELFEKLDKSDDISRMLIKANNYIQLRNDFKAIELYNQILDKDSSNLEALFNISLSLQRIENYDASVDRLTKFISLQDNEPQAYIRRGNSYYKMQKYNKALMDYNKALELNPNKAEAYYHRGLTFHVLQNYKAAIDDYSKAIDLAPNNSQLYNNRAAVYVDLQQYSKALEDMSKALSLHQDAHKYYNRGMLYEKMNNLDNAIDDFTKALEHNPEYKQVLNSRANTYRLQKKYELALEDANKAVKIDPSFSIAYGTLAEIYAEQGKSKLFYKYFELALSKGFPIESYIEDHAYDRYRKEERFVQLINKYKQNQKIIS